MAMQTDVKASKPLTSTGSFLDQAGNAIPRTRIKSIYAIPGASAGSVVITDGSGGPTLVTVNTPTATNAGAVYILVPSEGLLAQTGLYGTVTNAASVTVFYA
jgi:hypothetical protein